MQYVPFFSKISTNFVHLSIATLFSIKDKRCFMAFVEPFLAFSAMISSRSSIQYKIKTISKFFIDMINLVLSQFFPEIRR